MVKKPSVTIYFIRNPVSHISYIEARDANSQIVHRVTEGHNTLKMDYTLREIVFLHKLPELMEKEIKQLPYFSEIFTPKANSNYKGISMIGENNKNVVNIEAVYQYDIHGFISYVIKDRNVLKNRCNTDYIIFIGTDEYSMNRSDDINTMTCISSLWGIPTLGILPFSKEHTFAMDYTIFNSNGEFIKKGILKRSGNVWNNLVGVLTPFAPFSESIGFYSFDNAAYAEEFQRAQNALFVDVMRQVYLDIK